MKKYISLIIIILTILIALNGCTLFTTYKVVENGVSQNEKEAFAHDDEQLPEISASSADTSHKYAVETLKEDITAPDGKIIAKYDYSYPVFECNEGDDKEFIAAINEMFKKNALEHVNDIKLAGESIENEYEESKKHGYHFNSYVYSYDVDIHMDKKGVLSVTENRYFYTGGAHGGTVRESHNFDVVGGKKLMLSDLLYGTEEEITRAFTQEFMKVKEDFFDDPETVVPEELPNAQFCVDSDGVTAYFQQYQVGSYAAGFISATISDKAMLKYDFSDVAE